ncbi:MAG: carbohydrate-binding family 9-like protein [Sandaracinaceae bacterium]
MTRETAREERRGAIREADGGRPGVGRPRGPGLRARVAPALVSIALAATGLACSGGEPRTAIPTYRAPRVSTPPRIDGRLDDPLWQRAPRTERFVGTGDGRPADPTAHAQLGWDDDALYAAFDVLDPHLRATLSGRDPHLWTEDCVELMFDPDGDGENYVEVQLAPSGQTFDTRYDRRRVPGPIGHADYESGIEGAVHVRGRLNDEEDDEGYSAELRLPWSAFAVGPRPASPPASGDRWRMALYVLDRRQNAQHGVGWSAPLTNDFHVPARFGTLTFTGGSDR